MMGRLAQRFATAIERPTLAYAASLSAVAAAAALRAAIGLVMADPPDYMIFYPAILFATLIAGARGGLLATLASALTVWVLWLEGRNTPRSRPSSPRRQRPSSSRGRSASPYCEAWPPKSGFAFFRSSPWMAS